MSEDVQELMTSTRRRMYWNVKAFVMKVQSKFGWIVQQARILRKWVRPWQKELRKESIINVWN